VTDTSARPAFEAVALVGPGRAGTTIAAALVARGARVTAVAGRTLDAPSTRAASARFGAPAVAVHDAGHRASLVVISTPDAAIESAAAALAASLEPGALVVHLAGSRGLDALAPITAARTDVEVGALHPLQTLPSIVAGVAGLAGSWAAVAGSTRVDALADALELRAFRIADADRAEYHAAACLAANHLVALLAQVERIAADAGVPLAAFEPLVRATVDNVFALGPRAALTGPVSRGDVGTVARHLDALPADERDAYRALADVARRLANVDDGALEALLAARAYEVVT
jgi:predicted short-subunit dehydrogenase-like oxidoreductase (DUF2520 family)